MRTVQLTFPDFLPHVVGAVAGLAFAFVSASFFYDAEMPVISAMPDRVVTPMVEAGSDLTVAYSGSAPRQCPTNNLRLIITDSHGVRYGIAPDKITVFLLSAGMVGLSVPVPMQASSGDARFDLTYDKICQILGFWSSVHMVKRPSVLFIIKPQNDN